MADKRVRIAVVGAGVVGLTAANILRGELRDADITLIADKFGKETTSAVAAGIFRPGSSFRAPTPELTERWIRDSWDYWSDILRSSDAPLAGVTSISSYILSKDNPQVTKNHHLEDLVPAYRSMTGEELEICGGGWKYGSFYTTMLIECKLHLPWMQSNFIRGGGSIKEERVDSFSQLAGKYDLVLNCTGLGAQLLCGDRDLVPMRGQVVKVRAPWIKMAYYADYDTYIIPGSSGSVTLGGTRQYDSYNTEFCPHDAAAIMERCCRLLPSLRGCEVISHEVGLRPHRTPVRVEHDLMPGLKVVHCYGHGGYGVTCAPGTAAHAVKIGLDIVKSNMRNKL